MPSSTHPHPPMKQAYFNPGPHLPLSSAAAEDGSASASAAGAGSASADSQTWLAMPAKRTMARARMKVAGFILRWSSCFFSISARKILDKFAERKDAAINVERQSQRRLHLLLYCLGIICDLGKCKQDVLWVLAWGVEQWLSAGNLYTSLRQ